eukprot:921537-Rhodomonas_salina.2
MTTSGTRTATSTLSSSRATVTGAWTGAARVCCYKLAMRCSVLSYAMLLRIYGTELGYAATSLRCKVRWPTLSCYELAMRCPILTCAILLPGGRTSLRSRSSTPTWLVLPYASSVPHSA